MAISKRKNLIDLNLEGASTVKESNKAVAFLNWSVPTTTGTLNSRKGFPIFQNPEYPNAEEDILIALARKHGGYVEVTMKCRICLNEKRESSLQLVDDIILG